MQTLFGFTSVQVTAAVMLIAGIMLRLLLNKRQFDRRTVNGLQQFRSYWSALIITIVERVASLVAYLTITAGLFLLLIEWFNKSNIK